MINRNDFESWAAKQRLNLDFSDGEYLSGFTQLCWDAWTEAMLYPVVKDWEALVAENSKKAENSLATLFDEVV